MTIERAIRLIAGTLILTGLVLAFTYSRWWLLLTGFVGLNLFQFGITDWCPMVYLLRALGLKEKRDELWAK